MRIAVAAFLLVPSVAAADWLTPSIVAGPLVGVRLGGPDGSRFIYGAEGGAGLGPQRMNLGYERRLDRDFFYLELAPWYYVGASIGVGVDTEGDISPMLGVWEGLALGINRHCEDPSTRVQATIAVGYRYSGVHELYVTPKIGAQFGDVCI